MDFAHDPSLYSHNVRWRRDLGWSTILEPGVCETSSGHCWTADFIAQRHPSIRVCLLNDLDHGSEKSIHFHQLMGKPFSQLDVLRLRSQSEKVALH